MQSNLYSYDLNIYTPMNMNMPHSYFSYKKQTMNHIQSSFATLFLLFLLSFQTSHAVILTDTITTRTINATADQVWPYIQDFCNVYLYAPVEVSFCTTGVANEPGLVRFIALKVPSIRGGNGTEVSWEQHQITSISSKNRTLKLLLLSTNRACTNYNAVLQVLETGTGSQIQWTYYIGSGELCTKERFGKTITNVAAAMASNIEIAIHRRSLWMPYSPQDVLMGNQFGLLV